MKLATKGILALTLVLGIGTAFLLGAPSAFLVFAGGVLCLVIALVWNSLERLSGTSDLTLDEALALAAPTAAEEQKRAVLRTLKDLEYELSVGKITPEDFEVASAHFRGEAKRLIAEADSSLEERMEKAEERVRKHLAEGSTSSQKPRKGGRKKANTEQER